ncbi:MAG TPA: hypothetical protein VK581_00365 [Chthoniobacterales bacterium]|nr:hypothetical protein [Chthoniobacterales bacterium]
MKATLTAIDQRLKSLDPRYNRWLLIPSVAVVLILLTCLLRYGLGGTFRVPVVTRIWVGSIPLIFFSFIGLGISWRTRYSVIVKLAFILIHLAAVVLFLVPLFIFLLLVFALGNH